MDSTVKKVESGPAPRGGMGQQYLVSGKRVSMRLWSESPGSTPQSSRDYETVGFVIEGEAELHLEGQKIHLGAGDSWLVPPGSRHHYVVQEPLRVVEATSPPARVGGRDSEAARLRESG